MTEKTRTARVIELLGEEVKLGAKMVNELSLSECLLLAAVATVGFVLALGLVLYQ